MERTSHFFSVGSPSLSVSKIGFLEYSGGFKDLGLLIWI